MCHNALLDQSDTLSQRRCWLLLALQALCVPLPPPPFRVSCLCGTASAFPCLCFFPSSFCFPHFHMGPVLTLPASGKFGLWSLTSGASAILQVPMAPAFEPGKLRGGGLPSVLGSLWEDCYHTLPHPSGIEEWLFLLKKH